MARISLTPPPTLSSRIAEWFIGRRFGEVLEPIRVMGHHPQVSRAYGQLEQRALRWRRMDVKIRDLAEMATAAKIGCPWCMDFGYWVMHGHGISREKIEAVPRWRDSELFDPLERLVLEYAEAMTETPPTVDDELVKRLLDHLDEAQLVELTTMICLENWRSRFNSAAGLTGQGFKDRCEVPTVEWSRLMGGGLSGSSSRGRVTPRIVSLPVDLVRRLFVTRSPVAEAGRVERQRGGALATPTAGETRAVNASSLVVRRVRILGQRTGRPPHGPGVAGATTGPAGRLSRITSPGRTLPNGAGVARKARFDRLRARLAGDA